MIKKTNRTVYEAKLKGLSDLDAYRAGFPLSKKWKDETVEKKAAALLSTDEAKAFLEKNAPKKKPKKKAKAKPKQKLLGKQFVTHEIRESFCRHFVIHMNGVEAVLASNSKATTRASAAVMASRLLSDERIIDRIAELKEESIDRLELSADRVLQEFARVGFSDIRKIFTEKGHLRDITSIDTITAGAISSVEVVAKPTKNEDGEYEVEHIHKIRMAPKVSALDSLAKHFGLTKERLELSGPDDGPVETITTEMSPEQAAQIYKERMQRPK